MRTHLTDLRLAGLSPYTVDWQHLLCLLFALDQQPPEVPKIAVVEFIHESGFLKLAPDDWNPYPTQTEPRWYTDIAWARKIGVIADLVSYNAPNSWGITRTGREKLKFFLDASPSGELQVFRCFLWSTRLKHFFNQSYQDAGRDLPRPPHRKHRVCSPDPNTFELADQVLSVTDADSVCVGLSRILGFTVLPTRLSLAFALQVWEDMQTAEPLT